MHCILCAINNLFCKFQRNPAEEERAKRIQLPGNLWDRNEILYQFKAIIINKWLIIKLIMQSAAY